MFRKEGYNDENEDYQLTSGTEQGIKALSRASRILNIVEFQRVLGGKHGFVQEDADAS
ncbi:hypothetical protein [Levilactobacillus enshiensis]|uniref:hypothetical protein n=1 Tax=Levilactobacillus enshiensis TaxID=2590213 RepID=UPI0017815D7E|nr:hypothetical protein [Levilactobacillus enshiensis]